RDPLAELELDGVLHAGLQAVEELALQAVGRVRAVDFHADVDPVYVEVLINPDLAGEHAFGRDALARFRVIDDERNLLELELIVFEVAVHDVIGRDDRHWSASVAFRGASGRGLLAALPAPLPSRCRPRVIGRSRGGYVWSAGKGTRGTPGTIEPLPRLRCKSLYEDISSRASKKRIYPHHEKVNGSAAT